MRLCLSESCLTEATCGMTLTVLEVLGVSFSDREEFSKHFRVVCVEAARSFYAFKVLRAQDLQGINLWCAGLLLSTTSTYSAPAWWDHTDVGPNLRLQAVFNVQFGKIRFPSPEFPTHEELCEHLCGELSRQVIYNRCHVLHQLLPSVKETPYGLRPSAHNSIIPRADNRFRRNFISCSVNRLPYDFLFWLTSDSSILSMFFSFSFLS